MIIKSITIQNFRQYKNENKIEFSTDPDRNVTIILGVNTSGKTTIIQAFNWCLYETTSFKSRDMLLNSGSFYARKWICNSSRSNCTCS